MHRDISNALKFAREVLQYPKVHALESATGPIVTINGKQILMFGSYNYLGLANNENVKKAAIRTAQKYGVGSGGVRLLTGTMDIHLALEQKVASITGHESCMTIPSGYGTNVGVIPGLINLLGFTSFLHAKRAVIFNDEYNHASIVDGCRLSDAISVKYLHNDIDDLVEKVQHYNEYRKLIITDGIFSMDGDLAPIPALIDLAKKCEALLMVDDAHGFGAIGKNGAGSSDYLGRHGGVDINMGTFSKGIGVSGGFVSGKKEIIDFLRISCRSYMFSDSMSPAVVGAIIGALEEIENNPNLISELEKKSEYFRTKVRSLGLSIFNSNTHVVPVYTGDSKTTVMCSEEMLSRGVFVPGVRWPAVPKELGRLRFAISAAHSYKDIDQVLTILNDIKTFFPRTPYEM